MSMTTSVSKLFKIALISAVGIGFFTVGIFMLGQFIKLITEFKEIQSWDTAPARILSAELLVNKKQNEDDVDTYSVSASYTYIFKRDFYKSNTVYPSSGSDNFGTYHQDNMEQLKRYINSGDNFQCLVNPDRPSESVLFNDLRFSMVFVHLLFITVFGGGGFCILYFLLSPMWKFLIGRIKNIEDKPWLLTKRWRSPKVGAKLKLKPKILLIGSILSGGLFLFTTVFYIYLFGLTFTPNFIFLLLLTSALLFFAALEIKMFKQWNQKRRTYIHLDPHPGKIGGKIEGTIEIPLQLRNCNQLNVNLKNRVAIVTQKGNSRYEYPVDKKCTLSSKKFIIENNKTKIPFKLDIPQSASHSRTFNLLTGNSIWFLFLKFKIGNKELKFKFEVPVF